MVFLSRDVAPRSAFVEEATRYLLEELREQFANSKGEFEGFIIIEGDVNDRRVDYSQLLTNAIYNRAEEMEEANLTGFLHGFSDCETSDIIDEAVSRVFKALDVWALHLDTSGNTLVEVLDSIIEAHR